MKRKRPASFVGKTKETERRRKRNNAMAWPYLEGTIKIVVEITLNGKVTINVHFAHIQGGGPVAPTDNVKLADAVWGAYDVSWATESSDEAAVTQIEAINWEAAEGRIGFTSEALPINGEVIGDALPNNVAAVVSNRTSFTGRSKRGRTYYTGLEEGKVGGNNMNVSVQLTLLACSQAIGDNLDVEGFDHVVYSLYQDGAPRSTPSQVKITDYEINERVDTQRRRLPAS